MGYEVNRELINKLNKTPFLKLGNDNKKDCMTKISHSL